MKQVLSLVVSTVDLHSILQDSCFMYVFLYNIGSGYLMVHRMTRMSHWNQRTDLVAMTGVREQHLMVGVVVADQLVVATNNNNDDITVNH